MPSDELESVPQEQVTVPSNSQKGAQFWLVLVALLVSVFLAVLESYAVSTALPTIVADLHGTQFIWIATSYGIASTVLLPLSGGFAEIYGRRVVSLVSMFFFALGSALGGAAQTMNMLIAARTIQGAGAGGIFSISQIILSDMVTLQERGKYNGLFGLTWALGGGVGPIIGGALSHHTTWRWLFYLNIPIAGVAFGLLVFFLRVPTPPGGVREKLNRIDFIGNVLVIGATCAGAIGLTWGGVTFPWNSAQVLVSLCFCAVGLVLFFVYEWRFANNPVVPVRLISNITSLSGYLQIALSAFVNVNLLYYLPVYYQASQEASPTASGVDLFGLSFSTAPFSIIAGVSIGATKRYRPQIWVAWCLMLIGLGLTSTVTENTARGTSIGFQIIAGAGIGILYSASYFPVLAPLPVSSNAYALSFFIFLRTLAQVWGVTVGGAVLQNELLKRIPATVNQALPKGVEVAYAIIPLIPSLPQPAKDQVRKGFADSLVTLWRVLIAVSGLGLLTSLPMRALPLHTEKDENWALEKKPDGSDK